MTWEDQKQAAAIALTVAALPEAARFPALKRTIAEADLEKIEGFCRIFGVPFDLDTGLPTLAADLFRVIHPLGLALAN